MKSYLLKIGHLSTYLPTKCGIATYASNLIRELELLGVYNEKFEIPFTSYTSDELYYKKDTATKYGELLNRINKSNVDLLSIQHEFKLFHGKSGELILKILEESIKPVVITFHTLPELTESHQNEVLSKICKLSSKIIVFTKIFYNELITRYKVPNSKIEIIPHGCHLKPISQPFVKAITGKDYFSIVSFGLLKEDKGYENMINALKIFSEKNHSNFKYYIIGENHPLKASSQKYRLGLIKLISELNLQFNVVFMKEFINEKDLIREIDKHNFCAVPYTKLNRVSSGVIATFAGRGKPILTSKFLHALDIFNVDDVIFFENNYQDLHNKLKLLVNSPALQKKLALNSYNKVKNTSWPEVAKKYFIIFKQLFHYV